MRLFFLIGTIFFHFSIEAHDDLFPVCPSKHPEHDIASTETEPKPFPVYKEAPKYPQKELLRGVSGAVILEFTVTKEGKTTDIAVLSSTSKGFSFEAIKAVKKFRYEPVVVDGEPIVTTGLKHKITFEMESSESGLFQQSETLDFDPVALSKTIKNASNRSAKKAVDKITNALKKETNGFHKAALYYVKSSKEYEVSPDDTAKQKNSLMLSLEELSKLNQNEINVINLRSIAITALSRMFLLEEKYQETIDLLGPFLKEAWDHKFARPKVVYDATVNFSIASYNASELCYAYHGFNRAIQQGKVIGVNNPSWVKYRDTAKQYMKD